jgi:hypothetical protein
MKWLRAIGIGVAKGIITALLILGFIYSSM